MIGKNFTDSIFGMGVSDIDQVEYSHFSFALNVSFGKFESTERPPPPRTPPIPSNSELYIDNGYTLFQ